MNWTTVLTWWTTQPGSNRTLVSNPPLSQFDHYVNDPLLDRTTMGDPRLNWAVTFRSTHHVQVATTKSLMNRSLSLSLSLSLSRSCDFDSFVLIFVSFCIYILRFSIIVFVWILEEREKLDKNVFFRAFSRTQQNTIKYFPNHFLECNQTTEYFTLRKYFT